MVFYTKNSHILNDPEINITFDQILAMDEPQFEAWVNKMADAVKYSWDTFGCPPKSGYTEEEIVTEFNKLANYKTGKFEFVDELSGNTVIWNKARLGSCVDQFFPTMMKARINYNEKDNGYSIYEIFSEPERRKSLIKGSARHFKRDSFYYFSQPITKNDKNALVYSDNGVDFINKFHNKKLYENYGMWVQKVDTKKELSGYHVQSIKNFLTLSKSDIYNLNLSAKLLFKSINLENISYPIDDDAEFQIRLYKRGQRIFPHGFTAFRIGYIQVAVNFPPLTAKYIWQKYTSHIKNQEVINVYDSSAGWGGRILGCMSTDPDLPRYHYIGNDPNPDNFIPELGITRYEALGKFFNERSSRLNPIQKAMGYESNTFHIFQEGSEDIGNHPDFQQYKGKLDMVFSSPPYFNREAYAEDDKQSYKKFGSSYESWRDGFLRPTLTTAYNALKNERYILWNIADLLVGKNEDGSNKYLPLVQDSIDILKELGAEFKGITHMALMGMPGQNRVKKDENGEQIPSSRSYAKVDGEFVKTEPIIVCWKP